VPQKSIPARNDDNARGSEARNDDNARDSEARNDDSNMAALKVRGLALRLVRATEIHSRT